MEKKTLAVVAAVGIASAIAVPTIAFGNARREAGTLSYLRSAQTPFVAQLNGSGEVPGPGDTDGQGLAALTFDTFDNGGTPAGEVCWDLSYSGITGPTEVRIGSGAAGAAGTTLVTVNTNLGATSASGCAAIDPADATAIMTTPANYFVNVVNADFANGAIRGQLAMGAAPAGEIHMLATPLRAYDSRVGGGAKIGINEVRTVDLSTGKDAAGSTVLAVPPGATAAIVNLTVTETTVGPGGPGGFLTMYNADLTTVPATSSINWSAADQNIAVTAQVSVNAAGEIKVRDGSNATHFVVDVIGYLF